MKDNIFLIDSKKGWFPEAKVKLSIYDFLYNNPNSRMLKICDYLSNTKMNVGYGLNFKIVRDYIKENFLNNNNLFCMSVKQTEMYERFLKIYKYYKDKEYNNDNEKNDNEKSKRKEIIYSLFYSEDENKIDIDTSFKYFSSYNSDSLYGDELFGEVILYLSNFDKPLSSCISFEDSLFEFLLYEEKKINVLMHSIENISDKFMNCKISDFIFDDDILNLLEIVEIYTIGDLKNKSINKLSKLLFYSFDDFIEKINKLSKNAKENLFIKLNEIFQSLSEAQRRVIFIKYGIEKDGKELTLQEVGNILGVTRERVRQIESKVLPKIISNSSDIEERINLLLNMNEFSGIYFRLDYLEKILNSKKYSFIVSLILTYGKEIKYDSKYEMFYYPLFISIDQVKDEIVKELSNRIYIPKEEFCELSKTEQEIVKEFFSLREDKIYMKKNINKNDIVVNFVDELYPNGFHFSNKDDLDKINNKVASIFGNYISPLSEHAMSALLSQRNYCLVDRGTYKNRKYCSNLTDELFSKISDYALDKMPLVTYDALFNEFKNDLKELEINNKYYLKGVLDPLLDSDVFFPGRDSISIGEKGIRLEDEIMKIINESKIPCTLSKIKNQIPGLKDYVINNYIYKSDDVIWISGNKSFINVKYLNIIDTDREIIKNEIEETFKNETSPFISGRKVYIRMRNKHEEIFNRMRFITDHFSFYSLLQYLFKDDYYFRRPYISKSNDIVMTRDNLVRAYLMTLDKFDLDTVNLYILKMNIGSLYSYLDLMDEMSDEFVQVSQKTMIKKEIMNKSLNLGLILKISDILSMIFEKNDKIDTRYFNGYSLFPFIGYKWNKYLLSGIIKSYFSSDYDVENTTNACDTTEFIITKI